MIHWDWILTALVWLSLPIAVVVGVVILLGVGYGCIAAIGAVAGMIDGIKRGLKR